jgi:hypothetical protein
VEGMGKGFRSKRGEYFILVSIMLFLLGIVQPGLLPPFAATFFLVLGLLMVGAAVLAPAFGELDWLVDDSGDLKIQWLVAGLYFGSFLFIFWVNYDSVNDYGNQFDLYDVDSIFISTVLYQSIIFGSINLIVMLLFYGAMALLDSFEGKPSKGKPSNSDEQSFTLLYIASFLIPIAGIIIGAIYLTNKDKKTRNAGNTCLLLGIISIILGIAFSLLLVAFMFD